MLMLTLSIAVPVLERADLADEPVVESEHNPAECPPGHDHTICTLVGANLSRTMLAAANLRGANLLRANLSGADLRGADLMDTNMRDADFTNCKKGQLPGTALITLLQQAG